MIVHYINIHLLLLLLLLLLYLPRRQTVNVVFYYISEK